jgi:hypothetical protein
VFFEALLETLTFSSPRRAVKKKAATMRNASCLIPFLHAQELSGVIDEGIENASLKDNRVKRPTKLIFTFIPTERMIRPLETNALALGFKGRAATDLPHWMCER